MLAHIQEKSSEYSGSKSRKGSFPPVSFVKNSDDVWAFLSHDSVYIMETSTASPTPTYTRFCVTKASEWGSTYDPWSRARTSIPIESN